MGKAKKKIPEDILSYYSTLGIRPNAYVSKETVRKAYKAKAMDLHPDRNSSDDATLLFQQLSKAYIEVLLFLSSPAQNKSKKSDNWKTLLLGLTVRPSAGNENIVVKSIPSDILEVFKNICVKWYGTPKREQNGFKFQSEFRRTDGEEQNCLSNNIIHLTIFDNGTIMCQGPANALWNADHLPMLIKEVTSTPIESTSLLALMEHSSSTSSSQTKVKTVDDEDYSDDGKHSPTFNQQSRRSLQLDRTIMTSPVDNSTRASSGLISLSTFPVTATNNVITHSVSTMSTLPVMTVSTVLPAYSTHIGSTSSVYTRDLSSPPLMSTLQSHQISDSNTEPSWVTRLIANINDNKTELLSKFSEVSAKVSSLETEMRVIQDLSQRVTLLEENLVSTGSVVSTLKARLDELEKKKNSGGVDSKLVEIENKERNLQWRAIDQEARSRRNNLVFYGIREASNENCEKVLAEFLKNQLNISETVAIQRVHRHGRPRGNNVVGRAANKPRPLIALFLDFRQREAVRKAARHHLKSPSHFGVSEDLPIEIRKARQSLSAELKELRQRGKRATVLYPARLLCEGEIVNNVDVTKFCESAK